MDKDSEYSRGEDFFEELAKKYPDLMKKSDIGEYIEAPKGWYNIIEVLCGLISSDIQRARSTLSYMMERDASRVPEWEEKLAKALEDLPTIVQIKEKFGGLRFYIDGGTTEYQNYITFAESLSQRTCEECGAPGSTGGVGWIRTLCKIHNPEEHRTPLKTGITRFEVKLQDEKSDGA